MSENVCFVDEPVKGNCWNLRDSYGDICVACGCCSKDPLKRARARYEVAQLEIKTLESFNKWDQNLETREFQEQNIRTDLTMFRRMIRYYKKRIDKLEKESE